MVVYRVAADCIVTPVLLVIDTEYSFGPTSVSNQIGDANIILYST